MIFYLPPFPAFDCIMISKFTILYSKEEEASCLDDLWQNRVKKVNVGSYFMECVDSGLIRQRFCDFVVQTVIGRL